MKINVIGLKPLTIKQLVALHNEYSKMLPTPETIALLKQVRKEIDMKKKMTIKQRIDDALVWMHTNGYTKAQLSANLWIVLINEDYAHITSDGNVYGTVKV